MKSMNICASVFACFSGTDMHQFDHNSNRKLQISTAPTKAKSWEPAYSQALIQNKINRQWVRSRESGRQTVRRLWWMVFGFETGREVGRRGWIRIGFVEEQCFQFGAKEQWGESKRWGFGELDIYTSSKMTWNASLSSCDRQCTNRSINIIIIMQRNCSAYSEPEHYLCIVAILEAVTAGCGVRQGM